MSEIYLSSSSSHNLHNGESLHVNLLTLSCSALPQPLCQPYARHTVHRASPIVSFVSKISASAPR